MADSVSPPESEFPKTIRLTSIISEYNHLNIISAQYDNMFGFCPFLEFEVNVVIVLHDDHLITENFPLKLCRV